MAIYETKTGWQIKVMRNGHRFVDFVKGVDLKSDAVAIETQAIADFARGLVPVGGQLKHGTSLTLELAFDETYESKWSWRTKSYKEKIDQYKRAMDEFFVGVAKVRRLEDVNTLLIDKYIQHLRAKGNAPKTINNKLTCLSTILKHMAHTGRLKHCPIIQWETIGDNSRMRYYTQNEEAMLLDLALNMDFVTTHHVRNESINYMLHDFIVLLFDTGMRPWCEAHNICGKWLTHDDSGMPLIRIPKEFTKNNKERDVPMTGRVKRMLEKRSQGQDINIRLFAGLDYKWHCYRFWTESVRPEMAWGDGEVWYGMRHTFATRMLDVGADIRVVQQLMGHRNISQTAKYAKVTNNILQNSIAALDSFGINHKQHVLTKDKMEDNYLPSDKQNGEQSYLNG